MDKNYNIAGIQQIGIGVIHVYEAWEWYRKHLGMDLAVFDEAAEAKLMLPYTAGKVCSRHAILAMNHQGGSGLEIWQHTSRVPLAPKQEMVMGDLGIQVIKYKSPDVEQSYKRLAEAGVLVLSKPDNSSLLPYRSFYGQDPWGNIFEVCDGTDWFKKGPKRNGGVCGCSMGVLNMEKSIAFYRNMLGYDQVLFDSTRQFQDWSRLPGGAGRYRRVVLGHQNKRQGAFSELLGSSSIELIQAFDRNPKKIFEHRLWGDLGYIHLCFDVCAMDALKEHCGDQGHPFTVDSGESFDMGEAAGRFAYIEDPDGTLIEFVETHKIPIIKKIGWFYNLKKRKVNKPLPRTMLNAMFLNRTKKAVWPKAGMAKLES